MASKVPPKRLMFGCPCSAFIFVVHFLHNLLWNTVFAKLLPPPSFTPLWHVLIGQLMIPKMKP